MVWFGQLAITTRTTGQVARRSEESGGGGAAAAIVTAGSAVFSSCAVHILLWPRCV